MKYFYDTEFIEDGKTIDLISIGIVAEDGREYYAQNVSCDFANANQWVQENVLPHLEQWERFKRQDCSYDLLSAETRWRYKEHIAMALMSFCDPEKYGKPEFWGYYSAYDHVALCQLFGTMMQLPKGWPMYTRDIKQLCDSLGNPKLPEQGKGEHHALADARWNKLAWEFLQQLAISFTN
jgi:hypothetical protein